MKELLDVLADVGLIEKLTDGREVGNVSYYFDALFVTDESINTIKRLTKCDEVFITSAWEDGNPLDTISIILWYRGRSEHEAKSK